MRMEGGCFSWKGTGRCRNWGGLSDLLDALDTGTRSRAEEGKRQLSSQGGIFKDSTTAFAAHK